jgi:hypothetical protein
VCGAVVFDNGTGGPQPLPPPDAEEDLDDGSQCRRAQGVSRRSLRLGLLKRGRDTF